MRIHFTKTARTPLWIAQAALDECKRAGTIAKHVGFKTLTEHRGGPGFASALEVQLKAFERDRGRRAGNSGSYGASENYTATYDEWGFFLAALYRMDRSARCAPNFKRDYAVYYDAADFHYKTGRTYDPSYPAEVAAQGDEYRYRTGRNQKGRRGYGRVSETASTLTIRYATEDERTAQWLRDFQAGRIF